MAEVLNTELLIVKLDVQQWNIVIAGLNELPLKHSLTVFQTVIEQLQGQQPQAPPPLSNGVGAHSLAGLHEP